jgi:hypothetical protein
MPFEIRPYRRFSICCPVTFIVGRFQGHGTVWNVSRSGWRFSGNLPLRERWLRGIDVRDRLLLARMVDENRGRGGYDVETLEIDDDSPEDWDAYLWQRLVESAENIE